MGEPVGEELAGELGARLVMEPVTSGEDGPMRVSVWVPPVVILIDPVTLLNSSLLPLLLPLLLPVSVGVGVGGLVRTTLVPLALPEEPETGVGVCAGPSGCVKLSSPARKLEHTAWPALTAAAKSAAWVQLEMMQPATLVAMTACVGPHWHEMSLSWQPAAVMAEDRQGS